MKQFYAAVCSLLLLTATTFSVFGQTAPAPDDEGLAQLGQLKKISKKADIAAFRIVKTIRFEPGKGLDKAPVAMAIEDGRIELTAMEKQAKMGHLIGYNQFVKLDKFAMGALRGDKLQQIRIQPARIPLTDDGIFLDDTYGAFLGVEGAQPGSRIAFEYSSFFTDTKYMSRYFFHSFYPQKTHLIEFVVPDWIKIDIKEMNFAGYDIKKTVKKGNGNVTYSYEAINLKEVKSEPNSLARPYYLPHIIVTTLSYEINKIPYSGFASVGDLYKWYKKLYDKASNDNADLKTLVPGIIAGKSSDEEKIKAIYYWVQDNIRYIAYEEGYAGFVPETVQTVFKNKYGDCKGMANLVTEMLKLAGFDAHFAWVGTRDIPYDHNEVHSMCVDNHAICVLYHKGQTYFIDGTEKYAPLGRDAFRIQGKTVLVEQGENFKVEKVPVAKPEANLMLTKANLSLQDNVIKGRVKVVFSGEARNYFHNLYNSIPANKKQDFLKSLVEMGDNNIEASNVKSSDFKNRDIDISIEGDVEVSNGVTSAGKQKYLGIDFVPTSLSGVLPKDDRQSPFDLDYVVWAKDEISLTLPAGAVVNAKPADTKFNFKQNTFAASYTLQQNTLLLQKDFIINTPVIYPSDFTDWKTYINKIKEFNRNKISVTVQ